MALGNICNQLLSLRKEIGDCAQCGLSTRRQKIVFGEGSLGSKVLFVGEAPGEEEDKQGRPFVGRSGSLLNQGLEAAGWSREEVYITNTVMCRPPDNREPSPEEQNTCSPYLIKKIDILQPKLIVALGRVSAEYLIGHKIKITKEHGSLFKYPRKPEIFILPIYHPSYVLRNRNEKVLGEFYADIEKAKNFITGG